jgi:hypothetical protein
MEAYIGNTLQGFGLVLRVGSSKKLDPTFNTSLAIIFAKIISIQL